MIKKITLIISLFFILFSGNVYGLEENLKDLQKAYEEYESLEEKTTNENEKETFRKAKEYVKEKIDIMQEKSTNQKLRDENCKEFNDCLDKPSYMIDTSNLGLGGKNLKGNTAKGTVDNVLSTIITKLMIAFGVLALFIMTIGGGYMIFSHGQDELLNKGKGIFTAGLISLIVALGSGIIIKIVISLLY